VKTNVIKDTLAAVLKQAIFHRKGSDWFRDNDDTILVFNLQKSNFGDQYYMNLALWLRVLGHATYPKEHQCHIRMRGTALDAERQRYWETEVFNLEYKAISDSERQALIRSFMETTVLPFLLACDSLTSIKKLQREGRLKGAAITVQAQRLLQG
jgi:hypothetical protein